MFLKTGAIFERLQTLSDKSLKITFVTGEIPADQAAEFLSLRQSYGWLLFSPTENPLNEFDVPNTVPGQPVTTKSKSQKLRQAIYRKYCKDKEAGKIQATMTPELHYEQYMERIIQKVYDLAN